MMEIGTIAELDGAIAELSDLELRSFARNAFLTLYGECSEAEDLFINPDKEWFGSQQACDLREDLEALGLVIASAEEEKIDA